ncbi:MAG: phosphoesterase RecJ domain protein [Firmicutes bacterium]|nr:phosphoesterase RecJ domain protein [Bacillota bacterium]
MECTLEGVGKLLTQARRLVITGHIHADGDCLGSMLALYALLSSSGKEVEMLLDDDVPQVYDFLPGIVNIRRPGREVIEADLLVVLDASDAERITGVKEVVKAKIINIDHHVSNTKFADYWYIDSSAAATGEIIFRLLRQMNAVITQDIAVNLYTAIVTDCGFFRYANTTALTLRFASELVDIGVKPHIISECLDTKPLSSIITLLKVMETLELFNNGQIATITIAPEVVQDGGGDTDGLINYPRNISGVEIAIMFRRVDVKITRVSFRSRKTDVSRLALDFGGGGHARAAGCTVEGEFNNTKEKVLAAAKKLLTEQSV